MSTLFSHFFQIIFKKVLPKIFTFVEDASEQKICSFVRARMGENPDHHFP